MSLSPGARVRLPEALGGGEGVLRAVGAHVADVQVDGVGEVTVPVEAVSVMPPLPWSHTDDDGDRVLIGVGPRDGLIAVTVMEFDEEAGGGTRSAGAYVPLADLLDVLQRAAEEAP